MTGTDYELWCAEYLSKKGYFGVEPTKKTGDQGVDIIAYKGGIKWGIQSKFLNSKVNNKAVQS